MSVLALFGPWLSLTKPSFVIALGLNKKVVDSATEVKGKQLTREDLSDQGDYMSGWKFLQD